MFDIEYDFDLYSDEEDKAFLIKDGKRVAPADLSESEKAEALEFLLRLCAEKEHRIEILEDVDPPKDW